jgi:hypothetical protein
MTAPDQYCINVRKLLSMRRRPHMTHLGSEARVIAVAIKIDAARRDTLASHPSGEVLVPTLVSGLDGISDCLHGSLNN